MKEKVCCIRRERLARGITYYTIGIYMAIPRKSDQQLIWKLYESVGRYPNRNLAETALQEIAKSRQLPIQDVVNNQYVYRTETGLAKTRSLLLTADETAPTVPGSGTLQHWLTWTLLRQGKPLKKSQADMGPFRYTTTQLWFGQYLSLSVDQNTVYLDPRVVIPEAYRGLVWHYLNQLELVCANYLIQYQRPPISTLDTPPSEVP